MKKITMGWVKKINEAVKLPWGQRTRELGDLVEEIQTIAKQVPEEGDRVVVMTSVVNDYYGTTDTEFTVSHSTDSHIIGKTDDDRMMVAAINSCELLDASAGRKRLLIDFTEQQLIAVEEMLVSLIKEQVGDTESVCDGWRRAVLIRALAEASPNHGSKDADKLLIDN